MHIVFRADSGRNIGAGHLMRCLALAEVLASRGMAVTFVCRTQPADFAALVGDAGHRLLRLPEGPADWQADAGQTVAALRAEGILPDWLVLDHYGLDARWEAVVRSAVGRLMVIDDLADRPHEADLLLDQNLHGEGYAARYYRGTPPFTRILLGPRYVLLREEFREQRKLALPRSGEVRRILVFYGGVDAANQTRKAVLALSSLRQHRFEVDVVVGAANTHSAEIAGLCRADPRFRFHRQISNMAELMAAADLALGAGGTTIWERCCLGLPALVTSIAGNQTEISASMAQAGCLDYLGTAEELSLETFIRRLEALFRAPAELRRQSEAAQKLVDGDGVRRLADTLAAPPAPVLAIRRACESDVDLYFAWVNDPEVRRQSFDTAPIALAGHRKWFAARLLSPDSRLYVVLGPGEDPLGQVRLDRSDEGWMVDYSLAPQARGRRLAAPAIAAALRELWGEFPQAVVLAEVKAANTASNRVFRSLGFLACESGADTDAGVIAWRLG